VLDYFTEMKALWGELSSHRSIPNCVCVHPCRCEATGVAKIHKTEGQIMQFLFINSSYQIGQHVYAFEGEFEPRVLVDNMLHVENMSHVYDLDTLT
jgi:hypothetical protein